MTGKTIVISGVARGQGRAHAVGIAREGGQIIGFDVCRDAEDLQYPLASEKDLAETVRLVEAAGGRMVAGVADVRAPAEIERVIAEGLDTFGAFHGVVANAGIWDVGPSLAETTEELWARVLDVNLSGVWRVIKAASPHLLAQRNGSVVIIASTNAFEPAPGYGSYVVAKHGLIGLMRQLAYELAPANIRVNALCPGAVDTPLWNNPMGYKMFQGDARAHAIDSAYRFPMLAGRSALPSVAITEGVLWLLSDRTEHITGVALPIDGGHLVQPGWNEDAQKTGAEAERYRPPTQTPS